MKTGKLREVITIQNYSDVTTESGEASRTWSDYLTDIRAGIKTPSGREFFGHNKLNAQVSHVVTVRFNENISPDMRIIWGTRILNIEYISEDEKHARTMWIYCKEDVS